MTMPKHNRSQRRRWGIRVLYFFTLSVVGVQGAKFWFAFNSPTITEFAVAECVRHEWEPHELKVGTASLDIRDTPWSYSARVRLFGQKGETGEPMVIEVVCKKWDLSSQWKVLGYEERIVPKSKGSPSIE